MSNLTLEQQLELAAIQHFLAMAVETPTLDELLAATGGQLRRIDERLAAVVAGGEPQAIEAARDEKEEVTEMLLGIAFVACQVYFTKVIARLEWLDKVLPRYDGCDAGIGKGRRKKLDASSSRVPGTSFSAAQAIDAVANYWKHNDQWKTLIPPGAADPAASVAWDTSGMGDGEKFTHGVVHELGMRAAFMDNIHRVSSLLGGHSPFFDLAFLREACRLWGREMLAKAALRDKQVRGGP
jgi:hypothetical protein